MALALNDMMDAIGRSIKGVGGLNVYDYPPDSAQPPFAYLNMPTSITYDLTYGRGADRTQMELHVAVAASGQSMSRELRDAIGVLVAGSGPGSLKAAIENGELESHVRVVSCAFAQIGLAAGVYTGFVLTLDVSA